MNELFKVVVWSWVGIALLIGFLFIETLIWETLK